MVDDFSAKDHLRGPLDDYLKQFNGIVKVVRNKRREGLIRARTIGAQNSIYEVLVFLDAHCEAEPNWLPPLLAPIARNDRISTVPMIDGIDGNHYTFSSQGIFFSFEIINDNMMGFELFIQDFQIQQVFR